MIRHSNPFMSKPIEKQRLSQLPKAESQREALRDAESPRECILEILDSDLLPMASETLQGKEDPKASTLSEVSCEVAPVSPSVKVLADHINFLVNVAFTFGNRKDFLHQLYNYIQHYRDDLKFREGDNAKYKLLYALIDCKTTVESKEPMISPESVDSIRLACASAQELEAIDMLLDSISPLEKYLRHFLSKNPFTVAPLQKRFEDILFHSPLFTPPDCDLDVSIKNFRFKLWTHFFDKLRAKSMSRLSDFRVTPELIGDLLKKSNLSTSSLPGQLTQDFPRGELIDVILMSANRGDSRPSAGNSSSPNVPKKIPIEEGRILESLKSRAPQCFKAIGCLISLARQPDFKSLCPFDFQLLVQDLVPKPIPNFPGSIADSTGFVRLIQSIVESDQELDSLSVQMELNFWKSQCRNSDWWGAIRDSANNFSDPDCRERFQNLNGPYVHSKDIHTIPSPTAEDVKMLARANLLLEPDELPEGLIQEVLEKFPIQLDLCKATIFMQDRLNQIKGQEVLLRSIRRHLSLALSDRIEFEPFIKTITDDTLAYIQKKNFLIKDYVSSHELSRTLSEYGHSSKPQECFEGDHERIFQHLGILSLGLFRDEAPSALSDPEFSQIYTSSIRCNPSRNFDTAQIGIVNQNLVNAAVLWLNSDKTSPDYSDALGRSRAVLLNSIFPKDSGGVPECYPPENLIFSQSGSTAFDLISPHILSEQGDHILTSSEEYDSFVKQQNLRNTPCTSLDPINGRSDDEMVNELLEKLRADKKIRFMLVSDITRRGTQMPLELFAKARETIKNEDPERKLFLIVDGCQSFGRKPTDFHEIKPDAYFTSGFKVADAGEGGFALLSNSLIEYRGRKVLDCGSKNTQIMARLLLASDPMNLGCRTILDPSQRQEALRDLSFKFVTLTDKLIPKGQFKILRPSHDYRDPTSHDPRRDRQTGLFECKIQGFSRDTVSRVAQRFGLHIAPSYEDPIDPINSFRIAFHPRMGNESVLLLAYVLYLLTEMKRLNLPVEDCHKLLMKGMPEMQKKA